MCQDEIYCWLHKAGLLPSPQSCTTLSVLRFLYIKELRATLSVHKEIEHTMIILKTSFYTTLQSKISEA